MSSQKNQAGEIATVITLGALLILGISSLVSNMFLKNKITMTPKAETNTSCGLNKGARDVTGACNIACCDNSNDCPASQTCGVPNGQCKSGLSCAGNSPNGRPMYIRACLGGNCAWTWCDGVNYESSECIAAPDLNISRTDGNWCSSDLKCQTHQPINYGDVTTCNGGNGKILSCTPDGIATYDRQCIYRGKAWEVHRQCSQSNADGCYYWCKGAVPGYRYNCLDPSVSLLDDNACTAANLNNPPSVPVGVNTPTPNATPGTPGTTTGRTTATVTFSGTISDPSGRDFTTFGYFPIVNDPNGGAMTHVGNDKPTFTGAGFSIKTIVDDFDPNQKDKYTCELVIKASSANTASQIAYMNQKQCTYVRNDDAGKPVLSVTWNNIGVSPAAANTPVPTPNQARFGFSGTIINQADPPEIRGKLSGLKIKYTISDTNLTQLTSGDCSTANPANRTESINFDNCFSGSVNVYASQKNFSCVLEVVDSTSTSVSVGGPTRINCIPNGTKSDLYVIVVDPINNQNTAIEVSGRVLAEGNFIRNFVGLDKDIKAELIPDITNAAGKYSPQNTNITSSGAFPNLKTLITKAGFINSNSNCFIQVIQQGTGIMIGKSTNNFKCLSPGNQSVTIKLSSPHTSVIDVGQIGLTGCWNEIPLMSSVCPVIKFLENNSPLTLCYNAACTIGMNAVKDYNYTYSTRGGPLRFGRTHTFKISDWDAVPYRPAVVIKNSIGKVMLILDINQYAEKKYN